MSLVCIIFCGSRESYSFFEVLSQIATLLQTKETLFSNFSKLTHRLALFAKSSRITFSQVFIWKGRSATNRRFIQYNSLSPKQSDSIFLDSINRARLYRTTIEKEKD